MESGESKGKTSLKNRKHGVSFAEARTVFHDEAAVQFFDEENSGNEERYLLLGLSNRCNVLIVSHCERIKKNHLLSEFPSSEF